MHVNPHLFDDDICCSWNYVVAFLQHTIIAHWHLCANMSHEQGSGQVTIQDKNANFVACEVIHTSLNLSSLE